MFVIYFIEIHIVILFTINSPVMKKIIAKISLLSLICMFLIFNQGFTQVAINVPFGEWEKIPRL